MKMESFVRSDGLHLDHLYSHATINDRPFIGPRLAIICSYWHWKTQRYKLRNRAFGGLPILLPLTLCRERSLNFVLMVSAEPSRSPPIHYFLHRLQSYLETPYLEHVSRSYYAYSATITHSCTQPNPSCALSTELIINQPDRSTFHFKVNHPATAPP